MLYELASPALSVTLCDLGASVTSVKVYGREVALSPVGSGPDPSLAGRTVGPCCGRVREGRATLDGRELHLAPNEGPNHLHGGPHGVAHQVWRVEQQTPVSLRFSLELPHGLDGYPGNRRLTAEYAVRDNALKVCYAVATDRPTWAGLTSHLYWDLTGRFDGSAMDQLLEIAADRVLLNDAQHLPRRIVPAEGPFDFAHPASPGDKLRRWPDEEQFAIARGFNNGYLLREGRGFSARLTSPEAHLCMTLDTDQPALVFYSGGFLGPDTPLKTGPACPGCALALEAQHVPDPFHLPGQIPRFTTPDHPWRGEIQWTFHHV